MECCDPGVPHSAALQAGCGNARGIRSALPQACHGVGIHELAGTEGVLAPPAFDYEAKFFVECDRGFVVDIDCELEPPQVEPVVGGIDQRGQHGSADAAPTEIVMDMEPDASGMA